MRIAWTGPVGEGGGVPAMGLLIVREMLRQGVEVDVYTPSYGFEPLPLEAMPGLRIIQRRSGWEWGRWYSRTKLGAFFSGTLSRTVSQVVLNLRLLVEHRRRGYDAIYQLSTTELFLLGWFRRLLPPIVVHPCTHAAGELRWHRAERDYALRVERRSVHALIGTWLSLRSRLQPKALSRADLVLGLSERFNRHLHEDYAVPLDKLDVVRTPVDLNHFQPEGPVEPDDKRTLLFISRISARKGVEEVIELSHRLDDLADSVQLLVIGGPTLWSNYTAHLERLNPRVAKYLGGVPNERLPAILRSAAMLIVPSRYEPGSIATAEALACGLPVVLSDQVGAAEVVEGPHARGHISGDTSGLEAAVRSLLDEMENSEVALRAAARRNGEEQFAPSTVVAQLVERIARAARSPERKPGPRRLQDHPANDLT